MLKLIRDIAAHLNQAQLSGPIWKISETVNSNDDVATHIALLVLVKLNLVDQTCVNDRQVFRKKHSVTIDDDSITRTAGLAEAAYGRLATA